MKTELRSPLAYGVSSPVSTFRTEIAARRASSSLQTLQSEPIATSMRLFAGSFRNMMVFEKWLPLEGRSMIFFLNVVVRFVAS